MVLSPHVIALPARPAPEGDPFRLAQIEIRHIFEDAASLPASSFANDLKRLKRIGVRCEFS